MKKKFNIGDKVFAKIKGYPEWPAEVIEVGDRKCKVRFYGTGETGEVKLDCIYYYLENKERFWKISLKKRKGYNEAFEEIEAAIKKDGTDGNVKATDDMMQMATLPPTDVSTKKKSLKRKRSLDKSIAEQQTNKRFRKKSHDASANTEEAAEDITISADETANASMYNIKIKEEKETQGEVEIVENNSSPITNNDNNDLIIEAEFKITTPEHLDSLIEYAAHVRRNESLYKGKKPEDRCAIKNQVVVAKIPSGKYIAIPFEKDEAPEFGSEYERALYDESIAKEVLLLKDSVEKGLRKPEEEPQLFRLDIKLGESEVQQSREIEIIDLMKTKLRWLKVEANLVQLDHKIKQSLGLDKADPKEALKYMEEMLKLDIQPLMLKKQPHVVEIVRRLRKYVGNVKEWRLKQEDLEVFENDAKLIRQRAVDLMKKFSSMFSVPDGTLFWDVFDEELAAFKLKIADLKENQVLALHAEPDSRQTFLDQLHEQEGLADLLKTLGKDKENSSKAANLENSQANKVNNSGSEGKVSDVVDSTS